MHTCVCVCVAEGKSSICVCSWCWTRPLVADSIFRGRREEQDRRRRRRAFISLFFFSCWRKCQHASVCLPTGQKRKKTATYQQTHAREVRKRWRREGKKYLRRRREEGAIWSSTFTITLIQLEEWENHLGGELEPRVCLDLFLKVWCFFYQQFTFTERILKNPEATVLTSLYSLMLPFSSPLHCSVLLEFLSELRHKSD